MYSATVRATKPTPPGTEQCEVLEPSFLRPGASRLPSREHARGLIFGLIRMRSSTFTGIRINAEMQVANVSVTR
jgi:hypothetical protein